MTPIHDHVKFGHVAIALRGESSERRGNATRCSSGGLNTHGQKHAITITNRDAYVKANPEQEAALEPNTTHVVVDGSSRLAAAREAGLTTIKVMVGDDQGATSEELLESALVADIHRQDLNEMDEARALQDTVAARLMVRVCRRPWGDGSDKSALPTVRPAGQACRFRFDVPSDVLPTSGLGYLSGRFVGGLVPGDLSESSDGPAPEDRDRRSPGPLISSAFSGSGKDNRHVRQVRSGRALAVDEHGRHPSGRPCWC